MPKRDGTPTKGELRAAQRGTMPARLAEVIASRVLNSADPETAARLSQADLQELEARIADGTYQHPLVAMMEIARTTENEFLKLAALNAVAKLVHRAAPAQVNKAENQIIATILPPPDKSQG